MKHLYFVTLIFCICTSPVSANVVLPKIFSDNMVLQRNTIIPVWGWADINEKIEIKFNNQIKHVKADKKGEWTIRLDAENAGGPFEMTIKGKNLIYIRNILVGDVWICSGQSNMEWTVGQSMNSKFEIANADNSFIRHIKIERKISSLPNEDIDTGIWQICDTSTVASFTAVGYFFAKNLYDEIKVPIGLINSSWGGTNIETWISREGFENSDEFKEMISGMPRLNLDSLSKIKVKGSELRIEKLQGKKITDIDTSLFDEPDFDDSIWPEISQPQLWEEQSIGDLDGVVWLRKTIDLQSLDFSKESILELSTIDDNDITYVNGIKVGATDQWNLFRKYNLPPNILKQGKNVISIRVVDTGGGGGIYGDTKNLKLKIGDFTVSLSGKWKFQVESIVKTTNQNSLPSLCYNAMINPLTNFPVKGVLWYQGESNAGRSYQYRTAFPLLINDWRFKWQKPDMPFYFVQLATFNTSGNSNEGCGWAELREAQSFALKLPNTGMCVTTDIGNPNDIHPTNKQDVGKRLASIALNQLFRKNIVYSGPVYKSMNVEGNKIIISFEHIGSGLFTPDKYGYIRGFEIAGADQVFHYAKAFIIDYEIVVLSEKVGDPIAVRFGWIGDASECNLFNNEGFPAVPFRTDDWKTITKDEKYSIEIFNYNEN